MVSVRLTVVDAIPMYTCTLLAKGLWPGDRFESTQLNGRGRERKDGATKGKEVGRGHGWVVTGVCDSLRRSYTVFVAVLTDVVFGLFASSVCVCRRV